MPIDRQPAPTSRRVFLARAAAGGALAGAGLVAAGPLGFVTPAGAQDSGGELSTVGPLSGEDFAAFAVPLELAAVLGYAKALNAEGLDGPATRVLRQFQGNHLGVTDTLTPMLPTGPNLPDPQPNPTVLSTVSDALDGAKDQAGVFDALSAMEVTLAASHLNALKVIDEPAVGKTVAQVLATESIQASYLGSRGDTSVDELTPEKVSIAGARTNLNEGVALPDDAPSQSTTTLPGPPDVNGSGGTGGNTPGLDTAIPGSGGNGN